MNVLKLQLGSAINYSNIHYITNKIYRWYINKGFSYVHIKLKYKQTGQSLYLHIFEGQIFAHHLISKSNTLLNSTIVNKINNILIKELRISQKSIFNKITIDRGIIYLKKIQLLKTCNYKVKKHKQGLILNIEYSICTKNNGYIYNHNSDTYINNLLLYNIINYGYPLVIPINFHLLPNILQKFIKQISHSHINEVYITYLKYKNNLMKVFNFKYYLYYINYNYKMNLQTTNSIPQFEFLILLPYIKIHKIIFNFIKLNFYQKIYKTKIIYPKKSRKKNKIVHNVNVNSLVYSIIINQNTFKNFNYKIKYINMFNLFKEKFLYLRTSLNQSFKVYYYNKLIEQKITLINTIIKYDSLKYSKFLGSGKIFMLEFLYLKPQKTIKEKIFHKNKSNSSIKLKYYQIISLPKYLKFIKKNTIDIFININSFIIEKHYENILDNINNIHFQIYFQRKYMRMLKHDTKYSFQLEYHIFLSEFCSYYIFSSINTKVYNTKRSFQYNHIAGSGIQINSRIKRLPKIRFEYKINKHDINHYQIRLFSACTTNN
uniref:hypothetical protein n=1 Tax=Hypnea nidulans TaxID=673449 RepID=UPI0027DA932F|nr:hypothetical protein REP55_pgp122 [Hypnea nidulans]WCH54514.1 hypothetical protein [Hypnea nidulans]